jgi:hypothetical protein
MPSSLVEAPNVEFMLIKKKTLLQQILLEQPKLLPSKQTVTTYLRTGQHIRSHIF